jgi:hypothetical protein
VATWLGDGHLVQSDSPREYRWWAPREIPGVCSSWTLRQPVPHQRIRPWARPLPGELHQQSWWVECTHARTHAPVWRSLSLGQRRWAPVQLSVWQYLTLHTDLLVVYFSWGFHSDPHTLQSFLHRPCTRRQYVIGNVGTLLSFANIYYFVCHMSGRQTRITLIRHYLPVETRVDSSWLTAMLSCRFLSVMQNKYFVLESFRKCS